MFPLLRYTLDLFDTAVSPARGVPPRRTVPPGPRKPTGARPPAPDLFTLPLVDAVDATDDAVPLASSLQDAQPTNTQPTNTRPTSAGAAPKPSRPPLMHPAEFAHPRANRQSHIADALVAYEFSRARRRTIGFVVGPEGLSVRAPRWTPLHEVEAALQEKGRWILRKLQETRERHAQQEAARIEWKDGTLLPFLGRDVRLVLDPRHGFGGKGAALMEASSDQGPQQLHVGLPTTATPEQMRDAVQAWLMRQAQTLFRERLDHYAPQLQVRWSRLRLSSASTRWGSASADGSIRLNWRLVHFRLDVIDYVVVHELSHLRVMDHSPRFWDTVGAVVPDYASLRSQLRDDAIPRW